MNCKVLQNAVTDVSGFNFVKTHDPPLKVRLRPTYRIFWGCLYPEKTALFAAGDFIILFE